MCLFSFCGACMPKAMFIQHLLPNKIEGMIALLARCTPEDMTALRECLVLEETHIVGTRLEFEYFFDAIVYPIQSYRITSHSKLDLLTQIKRLYPNLERVQQDKLRPILMRMDPSSETPVALDALRPHQDLPLSKKYQTAFFGGEIEGYAAIGMIGIVKNPLEQRWPFLLKNCNLGPKVSDIKLAETYQAILNLLYTESERVQKSWEWMQIASATMQSFHQYYSQSEWVVRICADVEVASCPDWDDKSEEDFAFAVQRRELLLRVSSLLGHEGKKQRRELFELYHGLLEYSTGSNNPRILHALAFLRKELALNKVIEIVKQRFMFDKECCSNEPLSAFTGVVTEDYFAPCNSTLLSINSQYLRELQQAQQEYRVPQGEDAQQIADTKAMCKIYQQIAPNQAGLYSLVYKLLQDLVATKKPRAAWMKYFKLFINTPANPQVLPEQLPVVDLQEFDASTEMFKELERPPIEEWPAHLAPAAKGGAKKLKVRMQPACAIAPEATADTMAQISDHGAAESDAATEADVAAEADVVATAVMPVQKQKGFPVISLPQMPAPFKYAFRVLRWFNANAPLDQTVFPEYAATTLAYQQLIIAYHAFTSSVDPFVIKLALEMIWKNPTTGHDDTRYILPAEISTPELGKRRGIITYCIGKRDGRVYHRFFSEKPTEEIVRKVFDQAFYESDFPSIESAADGATLDKVDLQLPSRDSDEEINRHPFWGTITINNRRTKTEITLFPVKPEPSSRC